MATLVDSYSETNLDASDIFSLYSGATILGGQAFTGNGLVLNSAKMEVRKVLNPSGTFTYKIYSHSGTYGTSSVGDTLLATSDAYTANDLTTSFQLLSLNFTGANKITLTNGTYYVLLLSYSGGDSSNRVSHGGDYTSGTHSGNACRWRSADLWTAYSTYDMCFYVYGDDAAPTGNSRFFPFFR
jgi:hypothetical protein